MQATQEAAWQKEKTELQAQIQSILQLQPHDLDNITQGTNDTLSSTPLEHIYRITHTWATPLKEDLQQTHRQLQETQRRVVGLSDQLEFHLHENERLVKENGTLRKQRDKAESLLEEIQQHQMKKPPAQKEDIHTQLQALQQNHQDLQHAHETRQATLEEALAAKEASERRLAEASHCQEMLALDKEYLTKEVERLTTENKALQQTLETAQQDLSTLKP
jgi:chromosome segregation ATPase